MLPFTGAGRNMDVDSAAPIPAAAASVALEAASGPRPAPTAIGGAASAQFFPAGSSVIISGLSTRKDLEGVIGKVTVTTTAADERVAVRLSSGEQVRVKLLNVKPSLFPAQFG